VTKYFILNFTSAAVEKKFREIGWNKKLKPINMKLVFQRDFEIS